MEEIDCLVQLDRQVSITPWSRDDYLGSFNNLQHQIYVLDSANCIIGCVVIAVIIEEAEILQLWVNQDYQQRGMGQYMLGSVLQQLSIQDQIKQVFLEVAVNNTPAINLYHKCSFNQVGMRDKYYRIGNKHTGYKYIDALIMAKQLLL